MVLVGRYEGHMVRKKVRLQNSQRFTFWGPSLTWSNFKKLAVQTKICPVAQYR